MTDASIPLQVQQPASPIQQLAPLLALRNGMQDYALNAEKIAQTQANTRDIEVQAQVRQREVQDQQTLQSALASDPKNLTKLVSGDTSFITGKVSPIFEQNVKAKALENIKTKSANDSAVLTQQKDYHDQLAKTAIGLMQIPEGNDRLEAAIGAAGELNNHPGSTGPLTINGGTDLSDAGLQKIAALGGAGWQLAEAALSHKQQEQGIATSAATATKDIAQGKEADANRVLKEAEAKGLNQDWSALVKQSGLEPDIAQRTQALVDSAVTASGKRDALKVGIEEQGRRSEAKNPDLIKARAATAGAEETARTNASIASIRGNTPAGQPSSIARDIGEYRLNPATALARLPAAAREQILAEAQQINPEFRQENFNAFNNTEKDATTGKIATSAGALNTMMGHLGVLNQAADALKNGNIQILNKIANGIGAQTGSTAKTTYETIVHRLGPEVTKAYLASGGSVGERGSNEEDFSSNLSPQQIKDNIGISALLADSKIKSLQDQYQRGTYGYGKQKLISDEAEAARKSLAGQSPVGGSLKVGQQVKLKGGKTVTVTAVHTDGTFDAK